MYRHLTFRFHDVPFPVTRFTATHPEVRVVAYNVARDPEIPLPVESIYLVRAPHRLNDEIDQLFSENLEVLRAIHSPEPGVRLYHARFPFPDKGPVRGFLTVLSQALGTILTYYPIIMERGTLEASLLCLPTGESGVRLRAIEAYAKERRIGFQILEDRAVPMLPIILPRLTILDLLEWQVLQALDAAEVYDHESPHAQEPEYPPHIVADLADALGLDEAEVAEIRRVAEAKILHEFAHVRGRNTRLSTPPTKSRETTVDR